MTPRLPEWVEKRDGRREPFDADKISQALYAATEAIGSPNAFLAREMSDGVVHFLGQENEAETIATGQIAEVVEKVVRELGQPELAQAYARQGRTIGLAAEQIKAHRQQPSVTIFDKDYPESVVQRCLETYSLHVVFSRDLAAAHRSGLLELSEATYLQTPRLLESIVLEPTQAQTSISSWNLGWSQVRDASRRAGCGIVVDGAEWLVAAHGPDWLEGFVAGLDAFQRQAVLNVHAATPPAWTAQIGAGPLFGASSASDDLGRQAAITTILDTRARDPQNWHVWQVNWHVQESDLDDARRGAPLQRLMAQHALIFTLDRSRQPVMLFWGMDRNHPAVCLTVGLRLSVFLRQAGIDGDGAKVIAKLPSLARMAVSAGVQKRNYLRRMHPELSRAFLLDRALLVIEPSELESVVVAIAGTEQSKLALDVGRHILQTLRNVAVQAGQANGLDVLLDYSSLKAYHTREFDDPSSFWPAAGALPERCVRVSLPQISVDEVWRHLRHAWRTPGISHVRFRQDA